MMTALAHLEVEQRGEMLLVRIEGEIDISNAREVSAGVEAAMPGGAETLVIDLTDTSYLDSAGIQVLFFLAHRLHSRRQRMKLVVPDHAPIRAVLELTGIPRVIPMEARVEEEPAD
jgi:anti-sigma B factor antagonist